MEGGTSPSVLLFFLEKQPGMFHLLTVNKDGFIWRVLITAGHCGHSVLSSSNLFRCSNSQNYPVMMEGWGKGSLVNTWVFGGRNPICPAQEFGMLRILRQRGFTCVNCRFLLRSWIFPVCKHHNHRDEIPAHVQGCP